jgi:hypothetical protein
MGSMVDGEVKISHQPAFRNSQTVKNDRIY